jgi:hypothetical protein
MVIRDHTARVKKKNERVFYQITRILNKVARDNPGYTPGKVNEVLWECFVETVREWLIIYKQPFAFYKNYVTLRVLNTDPTIKTYQYDIKRKGNDPILFVSLKNEIWRKRKKRYVASFIGEGWKMFEAARERFDEYISIKESGYVPTND